MHELPFSEQFFDVIIFADILEHLKDTSVLSNYRRYLKNDGYAIISIPNVANWKIRLSLLLGKFDYKEAGILSRHHLRFYTLKTAKKMITDAGFQITYITSTSGWNFCDCKLLTRNPSTLWKSLLACNFIFKAKKSNEVN
jgi:2-polyprenyl-3-methyl-5-hydroxy-6-metoxy-1,4-benzoquinol methylase